MNWTLVSRALTISAIAVLPLKLPLITGEGWSIDLDHTLFLLALSTTLVLFIRNRDLANSVPQHVYKRILLYVGITAGAIALGTFNQYSQAGHYPIVILPYIQLLYSIAVLLLVLYHAYKNPEFQRKCAYAFLTSAFIVLGIYLPGLQDQLGIINGSYRLKGFLSDPVSFASILLLPSLISLSSLTVHKRSKLTYLMIGVLVLSFIGLWASGSRGALLGLTIGVLIFHLQHRSKPKTSRRLWLIFLVAMLVSYLLLPNVYNRFSPDNPGHTSVAQDPYRSVIWREAIRAVGTNPLGYGLAYQQIINIETPTSSQNSAHNILLELTLIGGIPLALLSLYLLYQLLRQARYSFWAPLLASLLIAWLFTGGLGLTWLWITMGLASSPSNHTLENLLIR